MGGHVRITDVSPRDGLQNEPRPIPTAGKLRLVELLTRTGVDEIEVTSFVSPKWVPQLGDGAEVLAEAAKFKPAKMIYSALVPNEKGLDAAIEVNERAGARVIDKVSVFTAASETFSKKNTNATFAETLERFRPVLARAARHGLMVRAYLSCVIACPFEGAISPDVVSARAAELVGLGNIDELDLGDTIGAGTPGTVGAMLNAVRAALADGDFITLHLHDTFGRAGACVEAALAAGIRSFDGAAGGLGGCPYASTPGQRAPGNVATERLVATVEAAGYRTNVDVATLAKAGEFARSLGSEPGSAGAIG